MSHLDKETLRNIAENSYGKNIKALMNEVNAIIFLKDKK